jgi:hypothetical protein
LKYLLDQRLSTIPQHQWMSKLLGFYFRVEYKSGTTNVVADALSCHDTEDRGEITTLTTPSFQLFDDLRHELAADLDQQTIKGEVESSVCGDKWLLVDSLITVNGRVYVPPASPPPSAILVNTHDVRNEGIETTNCD